MKNNPNIQVRYFQSTGTTHRFCEDAIAISNKNPRYIFAACADGQSGKKHCHAGANAALSFLCDYFVTNSVSELQIRFPDEIQYEIISGIRSHLNALAVQYHTDISEFASTMCAMACDLETDSFLVAHLGDGCIIGVTKDNQLQIISPPENGLTNHYTYLTTSPNALSHVRLTWGTLSHYQAIYLMTDGVSSICKGGIIRPIAQKTLLSLDFNILSSLVNQHSPYDDASIIMLTPNFNKSLSHVNLP